MRSLIYILFAWVAALSVLSAIQFHQITSSRSAARTDATSVWRSVICTVETSTLKNPKLTAKQRTDVIKFWTELLVDKVHTGPCA